MTNALHKIICHLSRCVDTLSRFWSSIRMQAVIRSGSFLRPGVSKAGPTGANGWLRLGDCRCLCRVSLWHPWPEKWESQCWNIFPLSRPWSYDLSQSIQNIGQFGSWSHLASFMSWKRFRNQNYEKVFPRHGCSWVTLIFGVAPAQTVAWRR